MSISDECKRFEKESLAAIGCHLFNSYLWYCTHYILGSICVILPSLTLIFLAKDYYSTKYLALASFFTVVLLTCLDPLAKASQHKLAVGALSDLRHKFFSLQYIELQTLSDKEARKKLENLLEEVASLNKIVSCSKQLHQL